MNATLTPDRPRAAALISKRVSRRAAAVAVRMASDALMVNAAVAVAFVHRYILAADRGRLSPGGLFADDLSLFARWSPVATLVSLAVFAGAGFYTRGRAYQGRYKALIVAQAVCLCYLTLGFLGYAFAGALSVPRGVLLLSWALTLAFLEGARLWATVWRFVVRPEPAAPAGPGGGKVERVLVIGGAGYIGSALLRRLLEAGYRVRLLDLFVYGEEPVRDLLGHPRLETHRADFRQVDRVAEAMRDMDAVIHLGAIVGDPACALDEGLTIDVNLLATRMIAEVAKGYGVNRFIFASTCSVYGACDEVLDERSAVNPLSLYARSKIASERVLMAMAGDRFCPVILRFGTIFGLSGRTRFDLVVNLLTAKAVADGEITVTGGDQWRPFVHVEDAALAAFKALEAPLGLVDRQIFNVGSDGQNYTLQQVGELIQRVVPGSRVVELGSNSDRRNYRVSFHKIRKLLSFEPEWSLERGVTQVKDAFGSGKVHDYRLALYNNFKFLSGGGTLRLARSPADWISAALDAKGPVDQAGGRAPRPAANGPGGVALAVGG
jgi:nucleoside-diphosphate-sugar epimerase